MAHYFAVASMLGGAVIGAELVLHEGVTVTLGFAVALLALVIIGAADSLRDKGAWRHA